MLTESAAGVYIISATPFTEAGAIDYASADRLVEFYLQRGVTGMTILGMMGEAPKLSTEESSAFMAHMLKRVAGRVPVIVGVSNAGIANIAALSHAAMDQGAAGVMIAPPSGLGSDEKHYGYFAQCFEALGPDVPVCHQDFPLSTGVYLSAELFIRMVRDFPQLVMLKHEDWPALNKLSAIRAAGGRRVSILCGNGGIFLPEEMARGADGAMTGFAFPEMLVEVVNLCNEGAHDAASDLFDAYLPLVRLEQQPGAGLAIRKEILCRRGAMDSSAVRLPGPRLSAEDQAEITRLLARLDRRLNELQRG
ncbi:dihydrodipicolinate synthase family protein [Chromatiales bacterium (ex Bugula neritina AB1)]|nr:dihydrodipicolinate synthase family protein [Chromatiales bacterium (ex Bugula neritina AB1)]